MPFGKKGRVFSIENLVSGSEAFDLSSEDARSIYENMKSKISNWRSFYSSNALASTDMQYLENAFNHWETLSLY